MPEIVLIDTDILIDVSRDTRPAVEFLDALEQSGRLAVSVVTQMELIVGCRNKAELRVVDSFLRRFAAIRVNDLISDRAVELLREFRLSHGLLIADAFIAATALEWICPLASGNRRHYEFIPELDLLPYHSR